MKLRITRAVLKALLKTFKLHKHLSVDHIHLLNSIPNYCKCFILL